MTRHPNYEPKHLGAVQVGDNQMTVMLWECFYRGKRIATVPNTLSPGLHRDMPDPAAIKAALPASVRHMELAVWHISGRPHEVSVSLLRKGGKEYYPHRVACKAYYYPQP